MAHSQISAGNGYSPADRFLWWLATADHKLISECRVDAGRYAIVGYSVLATWLFAMAAWCYFFSTVTKSPVVYLPAGIFMGFVILTIDRALIKGINSRNKYRPLPLISRLLLAATIGTFMAQPALLYLFDKEVQLQILVDNEAKIREKQVEADKIYQPEKDALLQQKASLDSVLTLRYAEVKAARDGFIAESDGTGGSGRRGIAAIATAKREQYQRLQDDYRLLEQQQLPERQRIDSSLRTLENDRNMESGRFRKQLNDGFLTRIEALNNLIANNSALKLRYYLIIVLLVLIELMPVVSKMLLPAGSYEERVMLQEELEKDLARSSTESDRELAVTYNHRSLQWNKQLVEEIFKNKEMTREEDINRLKQEQDQTGSFQKLWGRLKEVMMVRHSM